MNKAVVKCLHSSPSVPCCQGIRERLVLLTKLPPLCLKMLEQRQTPVHVPQDVLVLKKFRAK